MNPYQIGDAEASLLENHSSSVRLQTCFSLVSQACARIARYKLTESLRCPLQVLLPCCLSLAPCAKCLGYANSTMELERIAIQEREKLKRERDATYADWRGTYPAQVQMLGGKDARSGG